MAQLTEFLLTYDLPLLAAANEQRGSAWIERQTGVAVASGVLSRDDVLALQRFEVSHAEELACIWSERDQAELLELEVRVRSQRPSQAGATAPALALGVNYLSLALTVALLLLALVAALALIQYTTAGDGAAHWPAALIYGTCVAVLVLGWRLARQVWHSVRRGSGHRPGSEARGG